MSVIIKGAYPPIDCESCSYRGIVKCSPNYYSGTIPAGCPVHEIPPHGRFVDADWNREALIHTLEALKKNPKMDRQDMHLIAAFSTLGRMLEDAPTIIEAEEGAEDE